MSYTKNLAADHCAARHEADPIGIHHINADAGSPASACQTPASAGVKPLNSHPHEHGCKH